jgi:hypothetical protein
MKNLSFLFLILIVVACSDDNSPDKQIAQLSGSYAIVSFQSNIEVDLNNDGESSDELMGEINSFGLNDLEIRPQGQQLNQTQLVSFFFPKTWITFQYPNEPDGYVEFIDYGFGTQYNLTGETLSLNDRQYIEESFIDNVESNREVRLTSDLRIIDANHLGLSLTKEFYDFNSNDWISLNIEIEYEKN